MNDLTQYADTKELLMAHTLKPVYAKPGVSGGILAWLGMAVFLAVIATALLASGCTRLTYDEMRPDGSWLRMQYKTSGQKKKGSATLPGGASVSYETDSSTFMQMLGEIAKSQAEQWAALAKVAEKAAGAAK